MATVKGFLCAILPIIVVISRHGAIGVLRGHEVALVRRLLNAAGSGLIYALFSARESNITVDLPDKLYSYRNAADKLKTAYIH